MSKMQVEKIILGIEQSKTISERLEDLKQNGFYHLGEIHKEYIGKVSSCNNTFSDICGYYIEDDKYTFFVTSSENNLIIYKKQCNSKEEMIELLLEFTEYMNYKYVCNYTQKNINEKIHFIKEYLMKNYDYNEERCEETIKKLSKESYILFEFLYYIENEKFIPTKYAYNICGYTAEKIFEDTFLTPLGAFNYMIYIKNNKREALENLRKGLPRK